MNRAKIFALAAVVCFAVACAPVMERINSQAGTRFLVEEAVDGFGYALGLLAAKDPVLKAAVEGYYGKLTGPLSLAVANEGLRFLAAESIAYQVLARKMMSIVKLAGGTVVEGSIVDLGGIDPSLLDVGKRGYLEGLSRGGV